MLQEKSLVRKSSTYLTFQIGFAQNCGDKSPLEKANKTEHSNFVKLQKLHEKATESRLSFTSPVVPLNVFSVKLEPYKKVVLFGMKFQLDKLNALSEVIFFQFRKRRYFIVKPLKCVNRNVLTVESNG